MALADSDCTIRILWDDSVVYVFEFTDSGGTRRSGAFVHQQISQTNGSQTQVNTTVATIAQIQVATDPGTWIETLKTAARAGANGKVHIYFDDGGFVPWLPPALANASVSSFNLSPVFSITG